MQFSAVLNIFNVKTYLDSIFTNDLKRFFPKNDHSYRPSVFIPPLFKAEKPKSLSNDVKFTVRTKQSLRMCVLAGTQTHVYHRKSNTLYTELS